MKVVSKLLASQFDPAFANMERDLEAIIRKLFVESKPYSDDIKRLLIVNEKDCLDSSQHQYRTIVDRYSVKNLKDEGYVRVTPKLELAEHQKSMSYIHIAFEDVVPSSNPLYNNTTLGITCVSRLDLWDLDDYAIRPWKIAGYVHGILNDAKFSGIGRLKMMGASAFSFNEELGGVKINYMAIHDISDKAEEDKDEL